jgi:hypothetical protein
MAGRFEDRPLQVSLNGEGRDGDEQAGGAQRRGDRSHHHDHGAGIEGAARDHFRCVEAIVHNIGQLRLEFLVRGDLLEQPPPYVAYVQKGDRRDSLGEPAFVVLVVTDTVCDRMDGGKVLGGRAFRFIWRGAVDVGDCLCDFARTNYLFAAREFAVEEGGRKRLEGESLGGDFLVRDCGGFPGGLDFAAVVRGCGADLASAGSPD